METVKGLLKSKTFWFNVFTAMAGIPAVMFGVDPTLLTSLASIGNIGLRILTTTSLSEK